jgi:isopentenyl diphosphate isomerase/L-lactate dehydrogenase-like FMN-dependent dehydrogenase
VRDVIRRKDEGIDAVLNRDVQHREVTTLLECVHLIHCALPGMDMARPMLEAASRGTDALRKFAEQTLFELKTAMFITGARNLADNRAVRKVITPPLTYRVG